MLERFLTLSPPVVDETESALDRRDPVLIAGLRRGRPHLTPQGGGRDVIAGALPSPRQIGNDLGPGHVGGRRDSFVEALDCP